MKVYVAWGVLVNRLSLDTGIVEAEEVEYFDRLVYIPQFELGAYKTREEAQAKVDSFTREAWEIIDAERAREEALLR